MSEERRPATPIYDFDRVKAGRDLMVSHTEHHYEVGVVSNGALLTGRSLYVSQVREFLAPVDGLRGRETELDDVAKFCRGDQPYMWIKAKPWAGKSALLSWFTLFPPKDMTVIGFFITDRLADQNDHSAFTAAVLDQLAVLLPDQRALIAAATINRDGLRNELLTLAARGEAKAGRRLVLVVDGLDEDTGKPPIVTLLPSRPDPNLRVVVASRHGPTLPIPHGHRLAKTKPNPLTSSRFAADVQAKALAELGALLRGPEAHRDLLALITAANGLTASELTDLTGTAPFRIHELLHAVAGRSLRTRSVPHGPDGGGDPVYVLAHETLQRTAEEQLGTIYINTCLSQLHAWADRYRDLGWPVQTPDFLLRRHFPVLDKHGDLSRMAALALDAARHDRIRARTGGDTTALAEIRTVQQIICEQPDPDLLTTARLTRYRDRLHQANTHIPIRYLAGQAMPSQHERADLFTDPQRQDAYALVEVAHVVAGVDPDQAEKIVGLLSDPRRQICVLVEIARVAAQLNPGRAGGFVDRAEGIACASSDPWQQAWMLVEITGAVAPWDPSRAKGLVDQAEKLAQALTDPWQQAWMLVEITRAVAPWDPSRAKGLVDQAEKLAQALTDPQQQAWVIAEFARVMVQVDQMTTGAEPSRAEGIACTVPTSWQPRWVQAKADWVLAEVDLDWARGDGDSAESIAHALTDPQSEDEIDRVIAEATADHDPWQQAQVMAEVARTIAKATTDRRGISKAKQLLAYAWSIAGWEIPVFALPVVAPEVLDSLVSDILRTE
ncbi:hypothetical protein ACWFRF_25180 [Nocardia sp. NPDC055165]